VGLATIFYCLRFGTSLFVTSYNSQGYGGGIRPRLNTGYSRYSLCTGPVENTVPLLIWVTLYHVFHCSGTVRLAPDFVATPLPTAVLLLLDVTETYLLSRTLATFVFLASLFSPFKRHVTICY
jgi:hypothetical protein